MLPPNGPEQVQMMPTLSGVPVACAPEVADGAELGLAGLVLAVVLLLDEFLLLDEHAATARQMVKTPRPRNSFRRGITFSTLLPLNDESCQSHPRHRATTTFG
jgi:hypothetical protein